MLDEKLVKSMECIRCERLFECAGKPRNALCVNFKERNHGGSKVDQNNNGHIQ